MDQSLLDALAETTRPNVLELSRRLGVARNTVQARLDRLQASGTIAGYAPTVRLGSLGYGVLAFITIEISQGLGAPVIDGLAAIPEVLELHKITGPGDLLCRIVARSNDHLHDILERVLAVPGITRTTTTLTLGSPISRVEIAATAVAELLGDSPG